MLSRLISADSAPRSGRAAPGVRATSLARPAFPGKVTGTIAAGAAAALLAAGCTSSSSAHPAANALSPIQAMSLAAHQAKTISSFVSTLSVTMSGALSGTMAGTMQIRSRPSLLADADFSTISFAGQNLPGGMQEILTNRTMYLKMALLSQQLHKPWAAIPFAALQKGTGVSLGQLTQQVQSNNPLVQTQMLAAAKNVRTVGTQIIGGVKTTHYTGSYPVAAGIAKLPSSLRAAESKGLQALGIRVVEFNAWIDAQHQIRKIVIHENGSTERMTVTLQVTSINQPVSVSLPPASQVATIPASALQG